MLRRQDLTDIVLKHLQDARPRARTRNPVLPATPAGGSPGGLRAVQGRRFLSDYDIRKALTPGTQVLTIPEDAIVSPLAQEWLALKEIRIVRS